MSDSLGERLVAGIAAQDAAAISSCFADDAQFRALTPNGVRERTGAAETGALVAAWFGDSTVLELVGAHTDEVADKLHISYRFEGIEEDEPYVVEQQLYCVVNGGGKIERADLLCSGFQRV
jgi:hypothetical protein